MVYKAIYTASNLPIWYLCYTFKGQKAAFQTGDRRTTGIWNQGFIVKSEENWNNTFFFCNVHSLLFLDIINIVGYNTDRYDI